MTFLRNRYKVEKNVFIEKKRIHGKVLKIPKIVN
jgi:hypothetical protein